MVELRQEDEDLEDDQEIFFYDLASWVAWVAKALARDFHQHREVWQRITDGCMAVNKRLGRPLNFRDIHKKTKPATSRAEAPTWVSPRN